MKKILKYPLKVTDMQHIDLPGHDAKIISAINQNGVLVVYAEVNTEGPNVKHLIYIVGTGNPVEEDFSLYRFISTVQMDPFVWHVYTYDS